MKKLHATLTAAAILLAAALSQSAFAQPAPDCGGYGGRACATGAPAGALGNPVGPSYGAAPTAAYGGGEAQAPQDETSTGFTWRRRDNDGTTLNCRRGLDGTPRCEPANAEQPRR